MSGSGLFSDAVHEFLEQNRAESVKEESVGRGGEGREVGGFGENLGVFFCILCRCFWGDLGWLFCLLFFKKVVFWFLKEQ